MSTRERDYHHLRSELAELNNLLSMTPESAVIDRMSLEYRKEQAQEELDANPPPSRWPARAIITFNGRPVADSGGINAAFATEALGAFAKTVTSLAASQRGPLGERGVIPHQDDYRLLVTATTLGSFGFEIEEGQGQQTSYVTEESPVEVAIGQAKGIMESLVDNEEAIADAIADTDGRALDDLRGFLTVMADGEAVCSLSFRNEVFGFRDVGQVRRGIASLGRDNLREGSAEMTGRFQGFLPQSRRAEFVVEASGEVISCRVDFGMSNAEEINEILGQRVSVVARFMQVGNSRTRYTILDFGSSLTI